MRIRREPQNNDRLAGTHGFENRMAAGMRKRCKINIDHSEKRRDIAHMTQESDAWEHAFGMQMRPDPFHIPCTRKNMEVLRKPAHDFRKHSQVSAPGHFVQIAERS